MTLLLLSVGPSDLQRYLRDGPVEFVCAATLRQKWQTKLFISPNHSMLMLGQPV